MECFNDEVHFSHSIKFNYFNLNECVGYSKFQNFYVLRKKKLN